MVVQRRWQGGEARQQAAKAAVPPGGLQRGPSTTAAVAPEQHQRQVESSEGGQGRQLHSQVCGVEALRGNPLTELRHLCYAKVGPQPPQPWTSMHGLLLRGLAPLAEGRVGGEAAAAAAEWREWLCRELDVQWYMWVVSHLHLNAFR